MTEISGRPAADIAGDEHAHSSARARAATTRLGWPTSSRLGGDNAKAGLEIDWEHAVAQVRDQHHRKTGFMPGFERIVTGSEPGAAVPGAGKARRATPPLREA
jgi:hypothetical protein